MPKQLTSILILFAFLFLALPTSAGSGNEAKVIQNELLSKVFYTGEDLDFIVVCKNMGGTSLKNVYLNIGAYRTAPQDFKSYTVKSSDIGTINPLTNGYSLVNTTQTLAANETITFEIVMSPPAEAVDGNTFEFGVYCGHDGGYGPGSIGTRTMIDRPPLILPEDNGNEGGETGAEQDGNEASVDSISLPTGFSSETLSENSNDNISSLDLTVESGSTVTFQANMDLEDPELRTKLTEIDKYVEMGSNFIDVDSTNFPELDTAALVSLRMPVNEVTYLKVYRNGEDFTSQLTDLSYDAETETVSFTVPGFSRYEVIEETPLIVTTSVDTEESNRTSAAVVSSDAMNLMLLLIVLAGVMIVGGIGSYVYTQQNKSKTESLTTATTELPTPGTSSVEAQ